MRPLGVDVDEIDDTAFGFAQFRRRGLAEEKRRTGIAAEQVIPMRYGSLVEWCRVIAGRVVNQDIQPAGEGQRIVDQARPGERVIEVSLCSRRRFSAYRQQFIA